jgi:hypothetical protein
MGALAELVDRVGQRGRVVGYDERRDNEDGGAVTRAYRR